MTQDTKALIEEAKGQHERLDDWSGKHCATCGDQDWPCPTARLADALEKAETQLATQKQQIAAFQEALTEIAARHPGEDFDHGYAYWEDGNHDDSHYHGRQCAWLQAADIAQATLDRFTEGDAAQPQGDETHE